MKKGVILLFAVSLFLLQNTTAQEHPWKKYGFTPKLKTLSNGKYQEFHDIDTIVRIGSVIFDRHNGKIIGKAKQDSIGGEAIMKPYVVSRWISPDPLTEEYSSWSPYNYVRGNPIARIDPDGRYDDWYINKESGEHKWFEGSGEQSGYTHIGEYKVIYNNEKNQVEAYHQQNTEPASIISMDVNTNKSGGFISYKNEGPARFAMASAELGGSEGSTLFDALIIQASMFNRLATLHTGNYSKYDIEHSGLVKSFNKNGEYKIQDLFTESQYQSVIYKSYQDFSYGHSKRFTGRPHDANLSLALTYNASINTFSKLNSYKNFTQAYSVMSYAHQGGGYPSLLKSYKINFKQSDAPNLKYIVGSSFWKRQ